MKAYNKDLVSKAQLLRKNMTPEEKHLWYDFLKRLPIQAHRQYNIGNYIVDFYIPKAKTVIEVDGLQHTTSQAQLADNERDLYLNSLGISVLRYSNESIRKNFHGVVADILEKTRIVIPK